MSSAIAYHNATKYAPETINQQGGELDWSRQPLTYHAYDAEGAIDLAPFLPLDPNPFTGESGSAVPVQIGLTLAALSQWIFFTYGVTAMVEQETRPLYLRAAPSAGGLYPAECYVIARTALETMPAGLYGYDPLKHRLVPLWEGAEIAAGLDLACYGNAAVAAAPVVLVVTGIFERSAWRYRERAYRRILLDSGHLLGNATMVAHALGLRTHLTGAFCDERLNQLLRLDADEEGALAVVALNAGGVSERPSWSALPSGVGPSEATPPLYLALHRASQLGEQRPRLVARGEDQAQDLEARYGYTGGQSLDVSINEPVALADTLLDTIVRRRSTRAYKRGSMSRAQLARVLSCAYAPTSVGLGELGDFDRSLLMTFVAVSAVDGVESGIHYYAPHSQSLRLLRPGADRRALQFLCLGQELGGDAAAVIFQTVELTRAIKAQGDRGYRYLHMDAGMLGQRLNLAALSEGLGVSGIGGFFDDHVNALLGIPEDQAVVYVTTIGIPK